VKKILISLLFSPLFLSCLTQNRVVESGVGFKKVESIRLVQFLDAISYDRSSKSDFPESFPSITTSFYQGKDGVEPSINMEIKMRIPAGEVEGVMVLYWDLDGELIGVEADERNNQEGIIPDKGDLEVKLPNNKSQLKISYFTIPRSLWISIVNSDTIGYRVQLGNKIYKVDISDRSKKRQKHFFELAIEKEEQKAPKILDGQMRW